MKNLANCKPTEFLSQTNRIRKSVSKWLTDTDIINIRKRMPDIAEGATDKEKKEALQAQASKNINAMLAAVMEEHPEETLEVLALMCFVEPEHVDDYTMAEYFDAFNDLINNKSVMDFFTSLKRLGSEGI